MVGRCIPYWNSPFLVDMLVLGGVSLWFFFRVVLLFHTTRDTNVQIQIDNECLQFLSHVFQIKSFRPLTPDFTQTIWSFNLFAISHLPPPKKKIISPQKKGTNPVGPTQNPSRFFWFQSFHLFCQRPFFPRFADVPSCCSKFESYPTSWMLLLLLCPRPRPFDVARDPMGVVLVKFYL